MIEVGINMRMVLTIFLTILIVAVLSVTSKADVNGASKQRSVIHTKLPGEIRVMVIDTGIGNHLKLNQWVQRDDTDDYVDHHGHGTHITGIIVYGNEVKKTSFFKSVSFDFTDVVCKNVKIYSCKYFQKSMYGNDNLKNTVECINRAVAENIDVINYSGGGTDPNEQEYDAYTKFVATGGVVFTAAGNEHSDLEKSPYYPSSYGLSPFPKPLPSGLESAPKSFRNYLKKFYVKMTFIPNIISVENVDETGKLARSSNWHKDAVSEIGQEIYSTLPDNRFGEMTGTSQAVTARLHKELKLKCKEME